MCCVAVCVRSLRRACVASCRPGGLEEKLSVFCCRGKDFADEPCASAGAGVRLRSVVRCFLPVPPPFVLLPVVLRVPGGAVLAHLLFPVLPLVGAVWCCPHHAPRVLCAGFFLLVGRVLVVPPPPVWLWCPVLCFVVRRLVW